MMKTPLSLVPWSLVLSLYLLPPSFVSAQDISDDAEAEQPESTTDVEDDVESESDDGQDADISKDSVQTVGSEQDSALEKEQEQEQGAAETTAVASTFDPRRQKASES